MQLTDLVLQEKNYPTTYSHSATNKRFAVLGADLHITLFILNLAWSIITLKVIQILCFY